MAFSLTISTSQLDKPILQALDSTGVATAVHKPGYAVNSDDGRAFMYVYFTTGGTAAIAAVAGAPAVWFRTTTDTAGGLGYAAVCADVSDGALESIGAFLSILTTTYYGWIQTRGLLVDAPATDGANGQIAAGDPVGATADSLWTKITVGGTTGTGAIALMAGSGGYANLHLVPRA